MGQWYPHKTPLSRAPCRDQNIVTVNPTCRPATYHCRQWQTSSMSFHCKLQAPLFHLSPDTICWALAILDPERYRHIDPIWGIPFQSYSVWNATRVLLLYMDHNKWYSISWACPRAKPFPIGVNTTSMRSVGTLSGPIEG